MPTGDVQDILPSLSGSEQVTREEECRNEYLCLPQRFQCDAGHGRNHLEVSGHVQALVAFVPDAQSCADDDADDHGPARLTEEAFVALEGQPHKGTAQRNGDTVVGIATEDAHQQHQEIPPMEVLLTDSIVLGNEERHDALRRQFEDGVEVAIEENLLARTEEYDEDCRCNDADDGAVGACQTGCQIDKQGEQYRRGDVDGPRFPDVPSRRWK